MGTKREERVARQWPELGVEELSNRHAIWGAVSILLREELVNARTNNRVKPEGMSMFLAHASIALDFAEKSKDWIEAEWAEAQRTGRIEAVTSPLVGPDGKPLKAI